MLISDLGEFGLIERISSAMKQTLPDKVVGIGDDCAVIPISKELSYLVTTDALVEDVHFIKNKISPQNLGHKSLAVNLSDIAAKGGTPHSVFLTLSLPKNLEVEWIDQFIAGFHNLASKYNTLLLGGDITGSTSKISINVTVIGSAHPDKIKLRSTAKLGDIICVTDSLGDSGAGLAAILGNFKETNESNYLINRHYRPEPHLAQGEFLAQFNSVHAMMDVSDGLYSDIKRIITASHCGATINMNQMPISDQLCRFSEDNHLDPLEIATIGGEDYCLLLTVSPEAFDDVSKAFYQKFKHKLCSIGNITLPKADPIYIRNNKTFSFKQKTFNHFGEN